MTTNFECVTLALLSQINQGIQILAESVLTDTGSEKRAGIAARLSELQQSTLPATKVVMEFISRHTEETDRQSESMMARTAVGTNRQ